MSVTNATEQATGRETVLRTITAATAGDQPPPEDLVEAEAEVEVDPGEIGTLVAAVGHGHTSDATAAQTAAVHARHQRRTPKSLPPDPGQGPPGQGLPPKVKPKHLTENRCFGLT